MEILCFLKYFFVCLFAVPGHPELEPPRNSSGIWRCLWKFKLWLRASQKKGLLLETCVNGNVVSACALWVLATVVKA